MGACQNDIFIFWTGFLLLNLIDELIETSYEETFLIHENDYSGEFHLSIEEQIIDS
jgi:hypothetical protein